MILRTPLLLAATLLVAAPVASAQQTAPSGAPQKTVETGTVDVLAEIPGQVHDLTRDSLGRILYCTLDEVGRIDPETGEVTVLASPANAWFPVPLRALAETPGGDIAVLDRDGHIRVLVGGLAPALIRYTDHYMIQDATDLIVDARGNFLVASATPSYGQRGMNWIANGGQRWGYYLVAHEPVQLAADPLTGNVLISGQGAGGALYLVDSNDLHRPTSPLDTVTRPGVSSTLDDGHVAVESDGDIWWAASGKLCFGSRKDGQTRVVREGFGVLRGAVIAPASGNLWAASGYSLYLAEGQNPTVIREVPGVGEPCPMIAVDQGEVPDRGLLVPVTLNMQCFELTADNAGNLLLGGALWGSPAYLKRVTLGSNPGITTVATSADGLAGLVEGVAVAPDDSIYTLSRTGVVQHITEGPLSVTTIFSDAGQEITTGKDLVLDVNGDLYVGTREYWGMGKVLEISGGAATLLTTTAESRGLAAGLTGGMYVTQWNNVAFHGTIDRLRLSDLILEPQPGFIGMNYTNDAVWADGDIAVDVNGSIYTVSEDDWSLVRYDPAFDGYVRLGSSYLNHPSGLAIAPSRPGSGSTTGWSLYVSEFDYIWEKPSVPAPASTLVDASLGLVAGGRHVAGSVNPRFGRPRTMALAQDGTTLLVATSKSHVIAIDPATGAVLDLAGPESGLRGDLVALTRLPGSGRVLVANRDLELFEVRPGRAARLGVDPTRVAPVVERFLESPRRTQRIGTGAQRRTYVLEGWVVWGL
jgi:hypothetical protein